jgi:tetratricopeptide (TPR) repeat protein
MSDDESTRPIDLDALRAAQQRRSRPEDEDEAPTATGLPSGGDDAPASATRLDIAAPVSADGDYADAGAEPLDAAPLEPEPLEPEPLEPEPLEPEPLEPSSEPPLPPGRPVAQQSLTLQLPRGTTPADLRQALEAELGRTDELPAYADPEDQEDPETQTHLPAPPKNDPAQAPFDPEITSVTAGSELSHPADSLDDTRMARLGREQVHAAFAAAASIEQTAVYTGPIPSGAGPASVGYDAPPPPSSSSIMELDATDLESEPQIEDLASTGESAENAENAETGESAAASEIHDTGESAAASEIHDTGESAAAENAGDDELPRFALDSERVEAAPTSTVDSTEVMSISGEAELIDDGAYMPSTESLTQVGPRPRKTSPSIPPPASVRPPPSVRPPAPAYQPPAPVAPPAGPAYANEPDDEEQRLIDEGRFPTLVDLYRKRLPHGETPSARAATLHKIASVLEYKLDRPDEAFDTLVQAWELRPTDDEVTSSLDRVGKRLARIGELCERAIRQLHTADHETRVALLGHIVYWYERCLGRGGEVGRFVSELERLDKAHPVVLRRQAQVAASNGDTKTQRDLLLRALDRTTRRDEKVQLHIALASAHAGTPEAMRYYESAVAVDSASIIALQGLERIGREQERHAQVEWSLERQMEIAPTTSEKVDARLKLADLQETKFLRRERAAELLELVLEDEPANPTALRGLERCYHALRDWPKLARILRLRAENTYDKKAQVELLKLAAEVHESKLNDAEGAIAAYRDLLLAEPMNRRALTDLARLSEKIGDWGNMAGYKAKLAELAPTKREASKMFVQLGDMLSAPDRDPIAARMQYERAVAADPANAAAWEALQRVAAAAGDDRRVVACLLERAKHTDAGRQRATVLVELATLYSGRGEAKKAREAFEAAIKADPNNETAATTMLDVYTTEERWKEAAPLCELLVNAAIRDKETGALFTRLRLQTRIAAALGDADKAMTAALSALEARPDDAEAQADLLAVCSQVRSSPQVLARAKPWLGRIATAPALLPSDAMIRLAQIQRDAGEIDASANTLERVLEAEPEHPDVTKALAEVYLAQGDFPRACKLIVDMARNATSADRRFELLVEAGDIWAKKAEETEKAASVYEEARRIKPLDNRLLHTLMGLYGELGDWNRLSGVLEGIVQIQDSPERKAKSLFAMAQVVRDKIHDPARAADLFDQVLDVDKKRLDAFEELVKTLTEAKDWEALERSYRKMIARIKDDGEPRLRFALFQQLGLIYRDRLGDAARAYEALDAAGRIRPDDTEVRKIVTELLVVTDNVDNAVARTRELVARDPHKASLYAELYDLFLRQHYFDKAWCAVNVLGMFGELTAEQRQFLEDYPPMPLNEVPGQLVEPAWYSHILHADLDRTLTSLFALMTPAVARMRHAQLRPEQRVGRPFTPNHSRLYEAVRQTFANAAEILAMRPPELLLGDPSSPVPFAPALAPFGAVLVGSAAVEARAESLTYVVGKRLAEQRPELAARSFFPSIPDLTALLAAAVRVSRQEGAKDAASAQLDAALVAMMTPEERNGIRAIVLQATMEGGVVDVKRWLQAADLSSMRAGLLVAANVEPARKSIVGEPQSAGDLPPRERIGELYKFAVSDLYSDLRGAIGIAVQG